jgi:hypothetical protein
MDERLARIIATAAVRSTRELGDLAPLLKDHASGDLAEALRAAIASAVYEIHETVLTPVLAEFPTLKGEFEENLGQFGRTS